MNDPKTFILPLDRVRKPMSFLGKSTAKPFMPKTAPWQPRERGDAQVYGALLILWQQCGVIYQPRATSTQWHAKCRACGAEITRDDQELKHIGHCGIANAERVLKEAGYL